MGNSKTYTMLRAYADRLEADEKAVPVAYIEEYGLADRRSRGLVWADHPADTEGHTFTPFYTHPAPADAERLANCVLAIIEPYLDTGDSRTAPDWAVAIYRVLAAHSAQAQPPANQDKPVYAISRSMHSYYTQDEEEARQAEFDGANVQRIPAQPPAASVPDAMVCVWSEDEDGNWDTGCGNIFVITEGTPYDNEMGYCCYCGHKIDQVTFVNAEIAKEPGR